MKKFFGVSILMAIFVIIMVSCSHNTYYKTGKIIDYDYNYNCYIVETYDYKTYEFYGDDFLIGQEILIKLNDNGTKNDITDDEIISVS